MPLSFDELLEAEQLSRGCIQEVGQLAHELASLLPQKPIKEELVTVKKATDEIGQWLGRHAMEGAEAYAEVSHGIRCTLHSMRLSSTFVTGKVKGFCPDVEEAEFILASKMNTKVEQVVILLEAVLRKTDPQQPRINQSRPPVCPTPAFLAPAHMAVDLDLLPDYPL